MKRNENAFTLIELLAVIVILAIIALIAVPVVMNIINKANKSAFKDSAYGIIKAGELYYTDQLMEEAGMNEDKVFTFPNDTLGLEIKGSKPTGGTMTINKEGKISLAITNGKYCVTKGFEDSDVTISDDVTNCGAAGGGNDTPKTLTQLAKTHSFKKVNDEANATAIAEEVTVPTCIKSKTKCAAGTPVAIKVNANETHKFYVLNEDTTKNEVTLIMDRNLYSSSDANNGNVAWINESDYGSTSVYNDKGPLTALKILKQRTNGWTNIPTYTYTLENDFDWQGGSYTYPPISKPATATTEESPVENVRARLPRREEINAIIGADTPWLYENLSGTGDNNTWGYWTSTANSKFQSSAWIVSFIGNISGDNVVTGSIAYPPSGIRPVITLSK